VPMARMLPQKGSAPFQFCASDSSTTCLGFKHTHRNVHYPVRIREAFCCETTTVLTVTAIPGYAGKVNVPAAKAHSTSLTTIENVQFNTQPIGHHTKATMVTTMATETLLQSEIAGIAAAAAEAVALAKAAVKAARDVVALSEGQTLSTRENLKDFPSEADLLRLERARLTEMERLETMTSLDHVKSEDDLQEDREYQFSSAFNSTYTLKRDCNVLEGNGADSSTCPLQKINDITVNSMRQMERRTRRARASDKSENASAQTVSLEQVRKGKKSVASVNNVSDPFRLLRNSTNSKLLTAKEEIVLSQGLQDFMKLDRIRESYKEKLGREPTLIQWAKAAGVDQKTFKRRLEAGKYSREKMIMSNIRLVISIARNYQNRGLSLEDLIQAGTMGLIRGAEKFDSSRGFKFSTYAHWWIRQAIMKTLTLKSRTVRLPMHIYELLTRIRKAKRLLSQEQGKHPTNEEVAEVVGVSKTKMIAVIKSSRAPKSADRCIGQEQDMKFSDIIANPVAENLEDIFSEQLMKKDLHKFLLKSLNEKERGVMRLRYGLDDGRMKTLQEIGEHLCVSRERARQIE
ncbi:hypothetical protein KI387_015828, partial [Taxus chinensis]